MKYNIIAASGIIFITASMILLFVLGYNTPHAHADTGNYTIVDSVLMYHDNITQEITVLDYNTSSGAGKRLYRLSCYLVRQNNTASSPVLSFSFGDHITSNNITSYLAVTSPHLELLNGSEPSFSGANHEECLPSTFYADVGTDIIVNYRDPAGSPNDYLFVTLEVF